MRPTTPSPRSRKRPLDLFALEDRTAPAVSAAFNWEMQPRFGLDIGTFVGVGKALGPADGRIDIHNDPAFVQATKFRVNFDASPTASDALVTGYTWTISQNGALVTSLGGAKANFGLAEGNYDVTLRAQSSIGSVGTTTESIVVNDILFVSMGDSYASGEGSPEVPVTANDSLRADWADSPNGGLAHRSSKSAHGLAALKLENDDPHTSVTFVSVAIGGSEVDNGMLGPKSRWNREFNNQGDEWSVGDPPSAADPFGLFEHPGGATQSQLAEVMGIVGNRRIDALTVSIGGNDLGFAPLVTDLLIGSGAANMRTVKANFDAKFAGQANRYERLATAIESNLHPRHVFLTEYPDPTRDGNGNFTTSVLTEIASITIPEVRTPAVITPAVFGPDPNPFSPTFGRIVQLVPAITLVPSVQITPEFRIGAEVDPEEAQFAFTNILTPLNQGVAAGVAAARARGFDWNLVGGVAAHFRDHGLAATGTNRWFNTPTSGRNTQGPRTIGADQATRVALVTGSATLLAVALGGPLTPFIPLIPVIGLISGPELALRLDLASTDGTAHPNLRGYQEWSEFVLDKVGREVAKDSAIANAGSLANDPADLVLELVGAAAGEPVQVRVRAVSAQGRTAQGYLGTVSFRSAIDGKAGSELAPILNYTFTAADAGQRVFSLPSRAADFLTLNVEDVTVPTFKGRLRVDVPSATLEILGVPPAVSGGTVAPLTLRALTVNGSVDTGYTGTVTFPGNGGFFVVTPAVYTFTAADKGLKTFGVQFLTPPVTLPLTVTVTDTGPLPRFRQLQVLLQTGPFVAAGTGAGTEAVARMFSTATNAETMAVKPFAAGFLGGVRVAVADFNNDGVPDLAAAAGPGGGPHVRLFDGVTGEQMAGPLGSFFGFEASFDGGVQVAAGDIDGDGVADLILAAGPGGGPRVRVFSGLSGAVLRDFFAYAPDFRGGLSVAVGDVNGDGKSDIVTGAGAGGGPQVRAFDGSAAAPQDAALASFFAYAPDFFGGVSVAVGDTDGDGFAEILTGAGLGGGPQVNVFDARTGAARRSFHAFAADFLGGVNVSAVDVDRDGRADVVAGAGAGGGPRVRSFDAVTLAEKNDLLAFDPALRNGVHVGGRAKTTA